MTGFQVYDKVRIVGYPGVGVIVELNEPHYIVEFDGDPSTRVPVASDHLELVERPSSRGEPSVSPIDPTMPE